MDYKTFVNYIKDRKGEVSIPEVQQFFNCSYQEVKQVFDTAVANNLLVCLGDTRYKIIDIPSLGNGDLIQNNHTVTGNREEIKNKIKDFIEQRKAITIPILQKEFNLDYLVISKIISELVEEMFVSYDKGLEYRIMPRLKNYEPKKKLTDEEIAERREYLRKLREEVIRRFGAGNKQDNDNDDDEDNDTADADDDDEGNDDFDLDDENDEDNKNIDSGETKPKFEDLFYEDLFYTEDTPRRSFWTRRGARDRIHYFSEDKFQKINPDSDNDDIDDESDEDNKDNTESVGYTDDCADESDYDLPKRRLLIDEYKRQHGEDVAKKEEDEQLQSARQSLLNAIHNISVAQDDDRRLLNGSKYSKEYIDAVGCSATINRYFSNKFRITINNLMVAERFQFSVFLLYNGNKTCLSDDGKVLYFLEERLGKRRAREKLENHTRDKSWIYCENDKLFVPTDIKTARQDIFNMYYALRALLENF